MKDLAVFLSPSRQNTAQRLGFFASLATICLILFLHFPFEGYDVDHNVTTRYGTGPCPASEKGFGRMTPEKADHDQYIKDEIRCTSAAETQMLPFSEWRSKAPLVNWFGSVVHALVSVLFGLFVGGMWLWIFRTHDEG